MRRISPNSSFFEFFVQCTKKSMNREKRSHFKLYAAFYYDKVRKEILFRELITEEPTL